jgi:phosphohistidine phosphatase
MSVLVVGHQPVLGKAIAYLLGLPQGECSVRKGAVWWLRSRVRDGVTQTVVVSVQTPELL